VTGPVTVNLFARYPYESGMSGLISDIRFGVRMLVKRAGTSALAALALALGIGLTTTMFSIVNGAVLRGLPFEASERILHLGRVNPTISPEDFDVSLHDYADWRERQKAFSELAAFAPEPVVVSGEGIDADRFRGAVMTHNSLALVRVAPIRGRGFTPEDEKPGAPPVAIVSYRVWQTQLRADPGIVGRVLRVNGAPTEIIGVMPERFAFPHSQDIWLPFKFERSVKRGEGRMLEVVGRLEDGVSRAQAETEMRAIAAQLQSEHPENKNITVQVQPYIEEFLGGEVIATLFTMLGAVFGVLLIACANVTNLQLARALERAREIAIRTAIGAERWRIIRQLVVEGLLLAALGALLGIAIAYMGVGLFNYGTADTNPPFWIDIRIDLTVLAFVLALTVTAALLSTVLPALRVTRAGAGDVLKEQGRGTTNLRAGLLSRLLVGFAVTLSCALLLVSGLMIKSVVQIGRVSYAFKTDEILLARTTLAESSFPNDAALIEMVDRLEARLNTIGGIQSAAIGSAEPGAGGSYYLTKEGQPFPPPDDGPGVRRIAVTSRYFATEGMSATKGRLLNSGDRAGSLPVTVITQDFADRHYPGEDPIGKRVRLGRNPAWPWWTIVGVVPKLASAGGQGNTTETAFVPFGQAPDRNLTLLVAAGDSPINFASAVRTTVKAVDQDLPLFNIEGFATMLYRRAWPFRVFGSLFMTFGVSALVMAAAGLYGVLAFGVRLRTQEIGVRMALGAGRKQVVRMILRQGLTVVGIGLAMGLGIGFFLGPMMSALFFNVAPRDPAVFGGTLALLLLTGFVASLVPALRAASVDPLVALRES
jgi:putative ABC transport system permease protein